MRRAVFGLCCLLAAAPAFAAPSGADLDLRARLLLREIRVQSAGSKKDTSRLRSELSALEAENSAAPDDKVAAELRRAEADLALVDAGSPLPPPSIDETISDEDLPDRDAVAQPAPPRPVFRGVSSAVLPEAAGAVFDGSGRRVGSLSRPVPVPPEAPTADLGRYLALEDDDARLDFLVSASAALLAKLKEPDDDGSRAHYLAGRLNEAIVHHPRRSKFLTLSVRVLKNGSFHLVYRARDGGAVDELLGPFSEWSKPHRPGGVLHGGGGHKRRNGSSGKKSGGGDQSAHSGHKSGHKSHGGSGGGGDDGGGGGGGGGGAHHAKAPHVKGGGNMFDGGGSSGDASLAGPNGARHGRGAGAHGGRKGQDSVAAAGGRARAASAANASGTGRAHARAGKWISGDDDGAGAKSASGSRKKRGASVPLPKDFASRHHGSRMTAEGDGEGGGQGGDGDGAFEGSGSGMGRLGRKGPHRDGPPPAAALAAQTPSAPAQVKPSAAAPSSLAAAAAAPAAPVLSMAPGADEDLHDAVAAHAAPYVGVPATASAAAPAPVPETPGDSRPLAAACAAAAGIGLGAYAFRRSRRA